MWIKAPRVVLSALVGLGLFGCSHGPDVSPGLAARPVSVDQEDARSAISLYRKAHGLEGVTSDPTLEAAAQSQAMAMASSGELSHTVAGNLSQRLHALDVKRAADENVSGGYASLSAALRGWRESPPHDANLLDPKMHRMGIGSAYAAGARYHQYWSLILSE